METIIQEISFSVSSLIKQLKFSVKKAVRKLSCLLCTEGEVEQAPSVFLPFSISTYQLILAATCVSDTDQIILETSQY